MSQYRNRMLVARQDRIDDVTQRMCKYLFSVLTLMLVCDFDDVLFTVGSTQVPVGSIR